MSQTGSNLPILKKRVLVVDDDVEIRGLVRTVLNLNGYAVEEANGGLEALEKIERSDYDVVVLDLMMPQVSGYDVLERIERVRPGSDCVVLISAANPHQIEQAHSSVVRATLRKPFDIQDLLQAVRKCSDNKP